MALEDELERRMRAYCAADKGSENERLQAIALADLIGRNERTILAALTERKAPVEVEGLVESLRLRAGWTDEFDPVMCFVLDEAADALQSQATELATLKQQLAEREEAFQTGVDRWMDACFGEPIKSDQLERADRFTEEALELAQTMPGFTKDRAHALVDYVFDRPQGEINQEVGGVMVTLAALCNTTGVQIEEAAATELARIWTKVEQIRAKQAAKPTGSALPVAALSTPADATAVEAEREACAKVAEHYNFGPERTERDNARNATAQIIATAIRARTKES